MRCEICGNSCREKIRGIFIYSAVQNFTPRGCVNSAFCCQSEFHATPRREISSSDYSPSLPPSLSLSFCSFLREIGKKVPRFIARTTTGENNIWQQGERGERGVAGIPFGASPANFLLGSDPLAIFNPSITSSEF